MSFPTTSANVFTSSTAAKTTCKTPLPSQHIPRLKLKMVNENLQHTHEQSTKAMNKNNNSQPNLQLKQTKSTNIKTNH